MITTPTLPLHLCQVLEEEFINLQGQWHDVPPSWDIQASHLIDPVGLIQQISLANVPLTTYLWETLFSASSPTEQPTDVSPLSDKLNALLGSTELYHPDRFPEDSLSDELQEMVKLGCQEMGTRQRVRVLFVGDDLRRFNRLLLEDAFPNNLKSIYELRLSATFARIHELNKTPGRETAALCLSGGGIRSGTFSLGILQGLARRDLLRKFNYLSTVSGGGYIGGWLSTWINRHPQGLKGVSEALANRRPSSALEPEAAPLRYLREYSNFLTPKFSFFSADVWSFIAIYIRNLLINWAVLLPLLTAVLGIPRIGLAVVTVEPIVPWLAWALLVAGLIGVGMAVGYVSSNRPSVGDSLRGGSPYWRKRTDQDSFLFWCLLPLVLAALSLGAAWAWLSRMTISPKPGTLLEWLFTPWVAFSLFGIASHLLGWAISSVRLRRVKFKELVMVFITGFVGGSLLWVFTTRLLPDPATSDETGARLYTCFIVPLFLFTFFLAVTIFVGLSSRAGQGRPNPKIDKHPADWRRSRSYSLAEEDREWFARFSGWLLIFITGWSVFTPVVLFIPAVLFHPDESDAAFFRQIHAFLVPFGGLAGLLSAWLGRSAKTPASKEQAARGGWQSILLDHALTLGSAIFLLVLAMELALLFEWILEWIGGRLGINDPSWPVVWLVLGFVMALAAISVVIAKLINLNVFSLHAGYRNRLIRAFLGASRGEARRPNPFTGFDPEDNPKMSALRPGLLSETSFTLQKGQEDKLPEFILKLKEDLAASKNEDPNQPRRFVNLLSDDTKEQIENYQIKSLPSTSLKSNLIEDINRILEAEHLYNVQPFSELTEIKRAKDLLDQLTKAGILSEQQEDRDRKPLAEQNVVAAETLKQVKEMQGEQQVLSPAVQQFVTAISAQTLRGDYRLLLNRLLLDQAYEGIIKPLRYPPPPYGLMPVVNTALNLVKGEKMAWQQRKAEAFSVSPLHCGSLFVGYRRSRDYGGENGISLGTATAISGAAANSNMGYHSSSGLVTFVLTLFNVRLGWWLGNPGVAGGHEAKLTGVPYFRLGYPNSAIYPIFAEAFGLTDDRNSYVMLSDGGHFENLGLYEMVLRRCKTIVVVDGGQDEKGQFEDLGNAVRKIRIDLGIPINFGEIKINPRTSNQAPNTVAEGKYCAVGTINYGAVDDNAEPGQLIYIKPAFYGNEPRDIYNYAQTNPAFPHETTADQFFDEPQFESHRMLGVYILDLIAGEEGETETLTQLYEKALQHVNPMPSLPLDEIGGSD